MPRSRKLRNWRRVGTQSSFASSETHNEETEATEETIPSEDQSRNEATEESIPSEASLHSERHEGTEHEEYSSVGKKARTAWEVDVMNEEGIVKKKRLKTVELWSLPSGERVMVPFDKFHAPICDAAALYTGVLAVLAQETSSFPINYTNWRHIPDEYKEDVFNKTIMPKFHFEDVEIAKHWTLKNIGTKWKDFKSKLWAEFYDPSLSRGELISNCPAGIHRDQWSSFVNYRLSEKSMEMSRKNAESRKHQSIPHSSGSKSFARRRAEMEKELGRQVERSEVWLDTHKKKDGTYVNEEAKIISERIVHEMRKSTPSQSQFVSRDDAIAKVFGKEHPGRVRALGFGPCPSMAFGSANSKVNVMQSNDSQMKDYVAKLEKELAETKSQLQAQNLQMESQNLQMEDMKKTFGGALVTVFENALGKVPEQFANWLNRTHEVAPTDEGSGHEPSRRNIRQYSSSSHDVNEDSHS